MKFAIEFKFIWNFEIFLCKDRKKIWKKKSMSLTIEPRHPLQHKYRLPGIKWYSTGSTSCSKLKKKSQRHICIEKYIYLHKTKVNYKTFGSFENISVKFYRFTQPNMKMVSQFTKSAFWPCTNTTRSFKGKILPYIDPVSFLDYLEKKTAKPIAAEL